AAALPILDFAAFRLQRRCHCFLCRASIRPCRSCGNIAFALQPLPQLIIGASDMLAQGMPAALLIARKIIELSCAYTRTAARAAGMIRAFSSRFGTGFLPASMQQN